MLDFEKGLPDFYRHPAWIAFRQTDLILDFSFDKQSVEINNITLSFAHNPNAICHPPGEMQLWGGDNPTELTLLARVNPPAAEKPRKPTIEGVSMNVPTARHKYYRLIASPAKTPKGQDPKERAPWLMVDEVFIN